MGAKNQGSEQVRRTTRRWRFYATESGTCPVRAFLDKLPKQDAAEIAASMRIVSTEGLEAARHVLGDLYEVRVDSGDRTFRILFSKEGKTRQVLLALEAFTKKTQKTPRAVIELAQKRMADWRERGAKEKGTSK